MRSEIGEEKLKSRVEYYAILGVSPNATLTEIREAYFRRIKQCHPDLNPSPEAKIEFEKVQTAYKILGNVDRRIGYDRTISHDSSGSGIEIEPETLAEVDEAREKIKKDREVYLKTREMAMAEKRGASRWELPPWSFYHEKKRGAKSLKINQFLTRLTPEQHEKIIKNKWIYKKSKELEVHLKKVDFVGKKDVSIEEAKKHALKYVLVMIGFSALLLLNVR